MLPRDDAPPPPQPLPANPLGPLNEALESMFDDHKLPSDIGEIIEVAKTYFIRGQQRGYFIVTTTDNEKLWMATIVEDRTFHNIRSFAGYDVEHDALVEALLHILPDVRTRKYKLPIDKEPEDDGTGKA